MVPVILESKAPPVLLLHSSEEDVVRPATARPAERESVRGVNGTTGHELTDGEDEANISAADKDLKPVFLKGLFKPSLPRE